MGEIQKNKEQELIVNSVKVQPEEHNLVGRSVRLDNISYRFRDT